MEAPSRPILQQHLSVALASLEETWGNAEEIALPVQESGQTQCSETTALVPPAFLTAFPGLKNDFKGNRATCGTTMRNRHRLKHKFQAVMAYDFPVARSSPTAAAPCQTAWASRLSGAASCIPIIKDLLRCNLVEQWLSNPTDTLLFQYVTMIMSHTIIHL